VSPVESAALGADDLLAFSRQRGAGLGRMAWNHLATALPGFYRWLDLSGHGRAHLAGAVPPRRRYRLADVPCALSWEQVRRLLGVAGVREPNGRRNYAMRLLIASYGLRGCEVRALRTSGGCWGSCDRRRPAERRDFAILTVLARLGLRAGKVAALRLGDIDWRAGEITVHGKASREDRLPLTQQAGEAIAGWLLDGRPRCTSAAVLTRVLAPHRGLSDRAVSGVVRRACARAGLPPMVSHRLRHTVATESLRAGGTLTEVGQLLRQRSLAATSFGVGTILKRNVTVAATTLASLAAKSVSPHTLRLTPCIYSSPVSSST